MPLSAESLIAIAVGIGLAAATGLRVSLPLLVAALAARWEILPLSSGFEWLSTTPALLALTTASAAEVSAYYIPGLDYLLDLLAGPAAFVAGVIASAAVMVDVPPAVLWPVAIIGGGGAAGLAKVTSGVVRAKAGLATGGLANPVVSTGETAGAVAIAVAAVAIPVICLIAIVVFFVWMGRRARRLMARRPGPPARLR